MTITYHRKLKEINAVTLKKWLKRNKALLIDVREPGEFFAEHIPDAKSMPLSCFDPTIVPQNGDTKIVLQCQTGNRSVQAAQKMFEMGFKEVFYLKGGLSTWKAAGYPTIVNKNTTISMFRQLEIAAGLLVFIGTILGAFVSPWFLIISGLVGAGSIFAGTTNTCGMAMLLAKLPYNKKAFNTGDIVF